MADAIDVANELIDIEVSRALSKIRQSSTESTKRVEFCVECGDNIPEVRQKMGFSLCVPCAQEMERHKQLFVEY